MYILTNPYDGVGTDGAWLLRLYPHSTVIPNNCVPSLAPSAGCSVVSSERRGSQWVVLIPYIVHVNIIGWCIRPCNRWYVQMTALWHMSNVVYVNMTCLFDIKWAKSSLINIRETRTHINQTTRPISARLNVNTVKVRWWGVRRL